MATNERRSILRRNPYADRRSFIARAMGLSPIGDIAGATLSEGAQVTLTWETATDWDNAAAEKSVVHEGYGDYPGTGTIQLGYPTDQTGLASLHHLHEDSGSTAEDVSGNNHDATVNSITSQGSTGIVNTTAYDFERSNNDYLNTGDDYADSQNALTLFAWVKPESTALMKILGKDSDTNGRDWNLGLNGDGTIRFEIHNSHGFIDDGSYSTGTWQFIAATWDGSTAYIYKNGSQVGSTSSTGSINNTSTAVSIGRRNYSGAEDYYDGLMASPTVLTEYRNGSELQALYEAAVSGYLESGTKSFWSTSTPNLQNLSYSLNSQTIDLKVIGSPGTASEEVVTQTLDGSASYSLTWSNSHTDFRIRPEFSTSDPTVSPTFSRGELVA